MQLLIYDERKDSYFTYFCTNQYYTIIIVSENRAYFIEYAKNFPRLNAYKDNNDWRFNKRIIKIEPAYNFAQLERNRR